MISLLKGFWGRRDIRIDMKNYLSKNLAYYTSGLIAATGIQKWFEPVYGGIGHILMFHRIVPESDRFRIHNHQSLEVSPGHIESVIAWLKKNKFHFLSLDDLPGFLAEKSQKFKASLITFDDGYADNFEYGLPLFSRHKVPFTVYVATDIPDGKAFLWWYFLEELLIQKEKLSFEWQNERFSFLLRNGWEKERAFYKLRSLIISAQKEAFQQLVLAIWGDLDEYSNLRLDRLGMSWQQIRQLALSEYGDVGAHTVTHRSLAMLTDEEVDFELKTSKARIESHTGKPTNHLSYPFGHAWEAGEREFRMAEACGYQTATTTRFGNLLPGSENQLYALPRITVNARVTPAVLNLAVTGMIPAIRNRFRRVAK